MISSKCPVAVLLFASALANAQPPDANGDLIERARALVNARQSKEALKLLEAEIKTLSDAIKLSPINARAHFNLARALYELQRDDAAQEALAQAIKLRPAEPEYHRFHGELLFVAGEPKPAEAAYLEAIRLAPKQGRYRLEYARILAASGRRQDALKQLRQALADDPEFLPALLDLAAELHADGQTDEAFSLMEQGVERSPQNIELRDRLGQAYQSAERHADAKKQYLALMALDPDNLRAASKLVQLCEALKKLDERDEWIARVRKLYADGQTTPDWFCREQFLVGEKQVLALEFFELKGPQARKYSFEVLDKAGQKTLYRISLGSYDLTNETARSLGTIKEGERMFHLDSYSPRGHQTLAMYRVTAPSYEKTRELVVQAMEGKLAPLTESTRPAKP